jgi:actin-related protein 8
MHAIWDWILIEKLHIPHSERNMYSAVLVLPETFDNRGNYIWAVPLI